MNESRTHVTPLTSIEMESWLENLLEESLNHLKQTTVYPLNVKISIITVYKSQFSEKGTHQLSRDPP